MFEYKTTNVTSYNLLFVRKTFYITFLYIVAKPNTSILRVSRISIIHHYLTRWNDVYRAIKINDYLNWGKVRICYHKMRKAYQIFHVRQKIQVSFKFNDFNLCVLWYILVGIFELVVYIGNVVSMSDINIYILSFCSDKEIKLNIFCSEKRKRKWKLNNTFIYEDKFIC